MIQSYVTQRSNFSYEKSTFAVDNDFKIFLKQNFNLSEQERNIKQVQNFREITKHAVDRKHLFSSFNRTTKSRYLYTLLYKLIN